MPPVGDWPLVLNYTLNHNVGKGVIPVNTMEQDAVLGVTGAITQSDLAPLRAAARLGEQPVVYRVSRQQLGGGFGDQGRHPHAWAVAIYVDGQLCRVYNARGAGREWYSLDRLSCWLREQGFWQWWTRNDLEVPGGALSDFDAESG